MKISAKESLGYSKLKQYKTWFDKGFSELLDQRKEAKLQWLQNPSQVNGDNLLSVRHEASRHSRNRKREYLKDKNNEHGTHSKNFKVTLKACLHE
jgi:hypothetical protein